MRFAIFILGLLAAVPAFAADAIVKDGRTIQLGPVTYRLVGIDAPNFDQICIDEHAEPWACGVEARDQLVKQIDKRSVSCESRGPDKTFPKWSLGICTVAGEPMSLNRSLVRQGYAIGLTPNPKDDFKADEAAARADRRGLWRGCFVSPLDFRRWDKQGALLGAACPSDKDRELRATLFPDEPAMPPGCTIKAKFAVRARATGHVGVYQLQGCRSYSSLTKPDRWFCTEEDAQAEKFRRAYNCRPKK
jgi:endonuclease YncB( thermonuclease family)